MRYDVCVVREKRASEAVAVFFLVVLRERERERAREYIYDDDGTPTFLAEGQNPLPTCRGGTKGQQQQTQTTTTSSSTTPTSCLHTHTHTQRAVLNMRACARAHVKKEQFFGRRWGFGASAGKHSHTHHARALD